MATHRSAVTNFKLCLLVHSVCFVWYVFTLKANTSLEISQKHPGAQSYGGRWKYLTFINLVMQTVFFGFCVLIDLVHVVLPKKLPSSGSPSVLLRVQSFFYTVLAFPVGSFVCLCFWSMYAVDRELVFPKYLDDIIPLWLNHAMHTVVMLPLLVQMYLQHHEHPPRSHGILTLALFAALYLIWVLWVRHVSGLWVYPVMARLSPPGLVLFLSGASLSMAPLYLLGEKLTHLIWRSTGNGKNK